MTDKNHAQERVISFNRNHSEGYWVASVETPDGPIIGLGATIAAARIALNELLKARESED